MTHASKSLLLATAGTLVLLATGSATAVPVIRDDMLSPPGACTPNVPTSAIRYTVAGMKNIGTTSLYITCSTRNDWRGVPSGGTGTGTIDVQLGFRNNGSTAVTVRCVLYPGYSSNGVATSGGAYPKSMTLAAGGSLALQWNAPTIVGAGARFANPNVSCSLPPSVNVGYFRDFYDEDVGA